MWERGGCGGANCDGGESLWTAGCLSPNQQASGGSPAHYQALACEHASVFDSTGESVPPGAAPDGRVGHARARTRTRSHANKQALAQVHPRAERGHKHAESQAPARSSATPRAPKNLRGSDAVSGWVAADAGQVPQLGQTPSFTQQRAAKAACARGHTCSSLIHPVRQRPTFDRSGRPGRRQRVFGLVWTGAFVGRRSGGARTIRALQGTDPGRRRSFTIFSFLRPKFGGSYCFLCRVTRN